jgi:hypothetical protein
MLNRSNPTKNALECEARADADLMELDPSFLVWAGAVGLDEIISVAPGGVRQLGRRDEDWVVGDVLCDPLHLDLLGLAAEDRDGSEIDVVKHDVGRVEGFVCKPGRDRSVGGLTDCFRRGIVLRTRNALGATELLVRDGALLLPLVQVGPELGQLDLDAEVGAEACEKGM